MKTFPIRLQDDLHEELRTRAFKNKISIHSYILSALRFAMDADPVGAEKESPSHVSTVLPAPN